MSLGAPTGAVVAYSSACRGVLASGQSIHCAVLLHRFAGMPPLTLYLRVGHLPIPGPWVEELIHVWTARIQLPRDMTTEDDDHVACGFNQNGAEMLKCIRNKIRPRIEKGKLCIPGTRREGVTEGCSC